MADVGYMGGVFRVTGAGYEVADVLGEQPWPPKHLVGRPRLGAGRYVRYRAPTLPARRRCNTQGGWKPGITLELAGSQYHTRFFDETAEPSAAMRV